ncbi:MAG TPA: hypothetical protein VHQ47_13355 [Phycisphaerae bacterium]|jgi:hypothetical protein|nr:hypothetical protein [Phycisphaerae bacterium]
MTPENLMSDLRNQGIILSDKAGRLAYDAPAGTVTPELLVRLRAHKTELLALLQRPDMGTPTPKAPPRPLVPAAPAPPTPEAWFRPGALGPRREDFPYDAETKTHPGWWDYLYELHNRGLVLVGGHIQKSRP